MQIGQAQVVRENPIDRNMTPINDSFVSELVAPHGSTLRMTYTTPANRIAVLTSVEMEMVIKTAATTLTANVMAFTIFDDTPAVQSQFTKYFTQNLVGETRNIRMSNQIILPAGYKIECRTQNGSTGGTVSYWMYLTGYEYDA